ncbi:MAG: hypothetical protein KTR31_17270 [Myxococcales bacterium]|nr:hypothetical protein [Myxococcales bacterium]
MIVAAIGAAVAWGDACPDNPDQLAVEQSLLVLQAFDDADGGALEEASEVLDFAVGCLTHTLPTTWAVKVHRAKALVAYYAGNDQDVVRSWAAVRALDPTVRPDKDRWPSSHPMWGLYDEARDTPDERFGLERTPPGGWVVDGVPQSPDVPKFRAFLIQALDEDEAVLYSDYCYHLNEVRLADFGELDAATRQRRRKRMRVIGGTLTGALAAGAVTSGALALMSSGDLDEVDYELIDARAQRANTTASVALGLAVGAAGTGLATWSIKW